MSQVKQEMQTADHEFDRLNDRLANAEVLFAAIPAKSTTELRLDPKSKVAPIIALDRIGDDWALFILRPTNGGFVKKRWFECSLDDKTLIAQHLPQLWDAVVDKATERWKQVKSAHEYLDQFEAKLRDVKGGK